MFCFEEHDHRDRLGCAIGIDLLLVERTELRSTEVVCVDGIAFGVIDPEDPEDYDDKYARNEDRSILISLSLAGVFVMLFIFVFFMHWRRKSKQQTLPKTKDGMPNIKISMKDNSARFTVLKPPDARDFNKHVREDSILRGRQVTTQATSILTSRFSFQLSPSSESKASSV